MSRIQSLISTSPEVAPRQAEVLAPDRRDFERLLDARRRASARADERTADDRARRRIGDRPDGGPSNEDEVRAGRATAKLGPKRSRIDRTDRRELDRPEADRAAEAAARPPAGPTPAAAPATQAGAASATEPATPAAEAATPVATGTADTAGAAAVTGALVGVPVPVDEGQAPIEGGAGTTPAVPLGTPGPVVRDATAAPTDATTEAIDAAGAEQATTAPSAPEAVTTDGATTAAEGAPTAGTPATGAPAPAPDATRVAAGAAPAAGRPGEAATGDADADARGETASDAAGAPAPLPTDGDKDEPVRHRTTTDDSTTPTALTADVNGTPAADRAPEAAPVFRSGAVARAIDAALVGDRTNAQVTTRLAVELDDATRVAVHVHGQSVRVDVIEDANTLLDAGWRRDVAEGIRRHGLEYDRQGADANDGRRRRDDGDDAEPMTARDGGSRTRRRFTIDLDPAPST